MKPLGLGSAFTNKLPLASAKATYTNAFYHGANLEQADDIIFDFDSLTDNFARANYVIRLPRVVRLVSQSVAAFNAYYRGVFSSLATEFASEGICFTWARYSNSAGFNEWRWLADNTPDPGGVIPVADIYAGSILSFCLIFTNGAYNEDIYVGSPNAAYIADYTEFVSKHPRHDDFRCKLYNGDIGPPDFQMLSLTDAVNGTGAFAALGPGLGTYGWTLTNQEWSLGDRISIAEFRSEIESFFNL